jgi:hypothetical protein
MDSFMKLMSFLLRIDGFSFSIVLLATLFFDTLLAVRVRLKARQGFLSRRLKWGMLSNLMLALLPSMIEIFAVFFKQSDSGDLLLNLTQIIMFVGLFVADFGSIVANYRILYSAQTNWIFRLADYFFSAEINAKLQSIFGKNYQNVEHEILSNLTKNKEEENVKGN